MPEVTSISDLKKELERKSQQELIKYCLRLCRFKKENKELVAFMLYDAENIDAFVSQRRTEIAEMLTQVNTSHVLYAKKTIRKVLRFINKNIRISGSRQAEAELLLEFCRELKACYPAYHKSRQLNTMYQTQEKKIYKAVEALHPDLQYDLQRELLAL